MFNWHHTYVLKFKNKKPEKFGLVVINIIAWNRDNAELELNKRVDWNNLERFTYCSSNYFKLLFGILLPFTWFSDGDEKKK